LAGLPAGRLAEVTSGRIDRLALCRKANCLKADTSALIAPSARVPGVPADARMAAAQ